MQYIDYPYGLFNTNAIQAIDANALQQIHDAEQQKHIAEMVKAISDYCEASRKITPDYQQSAISACFAEIITQMNRN